MMGTPQRVTGCLWGLILVVAGAYSEEPARGARPYELIDVSPSVVMALNDNGSNLSCVVLDQGLVFFDTGLSTSTARLFRREMEARFERPAMALVLTHAHLDHIFGMAAFDDVPVHAAAAGRPRWEHFVAIEWDDRAIAGYAAVFPTLPAEIPDARIRMPTDWFSDELVLGSGDGSITVRRTGGHTLDSSSVVIGADKLVIAGDLVQARRRPYFGEPDTDFDAWIAAMRDWEKLGIGAVCPGHGPVIDGVELAAVRRWFEAATVEMAETKAKGAALEEVLADPQLPDGYWPDEDETPRWWAYCIKRLYDAS